MKNTLKWAALLSTVLFTAVSCSDDDKKDTPDPAIEAVKGTYTGTMTFAPVAPAPTVIEEPAAGEPLEFSVTDNAIKFKAFPIRSLVVSIIGEAGADAIVAAAGDIAYEIPYSAKFNADKSGVAMTLTPQPLELNITVGMAMNIIVTVKVIENANYVTTDKKLSLVLNAASVTLDGADFPFTPLALTFNMTKK